MGANVYWCAICGCPIMGADADDRHTVDSSGEDCHADCCPTCHPAVPAQSAYTVPQIDNNPEGSNTMSTTPIDDAVRDLVEEVVEEALRDQDVSEEVTYAIDNYDFTYIVEDVISDYDFTRQIDDYDLESRIEDVVEGRISDRLEARIEKVVADAFRAAHNSVSEVKF